MADLAPKIFRGNQVGWGSILSTAYSQPLLGVTEISYAEEHDDEVVYGAGRYPQGISQGNVKYTGGIKMYRWQANQIIEAIQVQGGSSLQDADVFAFTVLTKTDGEAYADTVYMKFKNMNRSMKQGDKMDIVDAQATVVNIIWDVR